VIGQGEAAPAPDQRVHGERQPAAAPQPNQPGEAAIVIEVAVAEHHGLDRGRIEVEPLEVDRHPVW
jgi:hypothetical protein